MTESKSNSQILPKLQRLASLDALRGFTMFWIIGVSKARGAELLVSLIYLPQTGNHRGLPLHWNYDIDSIP